MEFIVNQSESEGYIHIYGYRGLWFYTVCTWDECVCFHGYETSKKNALIQVKCIIAKNFTQKIKILNGKR